MQTTTPAHGMIKLPSHPDSKISDPLSILDSDDALVQYWDFLTVLLRPLHVNASVGESQLQVFKFVDALETICYSLTGNGSPDFSLLSGVPITQLSRLIGPIVKSILSMKDLFPDGYLPILGQSSDILCSESSSRSANRPIALEGTSQGDQQDKMVKLTHAQICCLVCHMFIGTFSKPPWMSWDGPNLGPAWFADDQKGDKNIKQAYIQVLIVYLEDILPPGPGSSVNGNRNDAPAVTYLLSDLHNEHGMGNSLDMEWPLPLDDLFASWSSRFSNKNLIPLHIFLLEEEDDDYQACFTTDDKEGKEEYCQLISANKEIGFGPAATQEERAFGSTSALLPSVLMTPTLSTTQALLISGDTKVYGHYTGHLRSAQLRKLYSSSERTCQNRTGRTFLFLDAIEMDGDNHGKDLEMKNMVREMYKLIAGFNALMRHTSLRSQDSLQEVGRRVIVIFPPWGCGTFGGDFKVKLPLIWMAATICGVSELRFAAKEAWWQALDEEWRMLIEKIRGNEVTGKIRSVGDLLIRLEKRRMANESIDWSE